MQSLKRIKLETGRHEAVPVEMNEKAAEALSPCPGAAKGSDELDQNGKACNEPPKRMSETSPVAPDPAVHIALEYESPRNEEKEADWDDDSDTAQQPAEGEQDGDIEGQDRLKKEEETSHGEEVDDEVQAELAFLRRGRSRGKDKQKMHRRRMKKSGLGEACRSRSKSSTPSEACRRSSEACGTPVPRRVPASPRSVSPISQPAMRSPPRGSRSRSPIERKLPFMRRGRRRTRCGVKNRTAGSKQQSSIPRITKVELYQQRAMLEVYIGNMTPLTSIEMLKENMCSFLEMLPEFVRRYGPNADPINRIQRPEPTRSDLLMCNFCFMEMADACLATTLVNMSGIKIQGRSIRISRPSHGPSEDKAPPGLDVTILRDAALLPWIGGPSAQMNSEIYVGNFNNAIESAQELRSLLSDFILSIPEVKARFPDLKHPVDVIHMGQGNQFGFVDLANEVLASTLVKMEAIECEGYTMCTGWPCAGKRPPQKSAPPLEIASMVSFKELVAAATATTEEDQAVVATKEIYLGGTKGISVASLVKTCSEALMALPSFKEVYAEDFEPVESIRTGPASYAFIRFADALCASTIFAINYLIVDGKRVHCHRPMRYGRGTIAPVPPLSLASLEATRLPNPKTVPPPPPPKRRPKKVSIHIGNIKPHPLGYEHLWKLLDMELNNVAISSLKDYDFLLGPPIAKLDLHKCCCFAFAELRDPKLATRLIQIWDHLPFGGRSLSAELSSKSRTKGLRDAEACEASQLQEQKPESCLKAAGELPDEEKGGSFDGESKTLLKQETREVSSVIDWPVKAEASAVIDSSDVSQPWNLESALPPPPPPWRNSGDASFPLADHQIDVDEL